MSELAIKQRVYHRRADLFGRIEVVEGDVAKVKYEWPWDPEGPPRSVPLIELIPAGSVPS